MWKSLLPLLALSLMQVQPQVGQPGKDVVYLPTMPALVDKMLDLAHVTAQDYVIDLGSGDGRTVIAAAKRGARGLGIEFDDNLVALSTKNAAAEGVGASATFVKEDLFEADLTKATVVTMFLLPEINLRLRPKLLTLSPGTRIVSNTFAMGDWNPDETAQVEGQCGNWCTAFLWIVPARVEGGWKMQQGELWFKQAYQVVGGTFEAGDASGLVVNGRVNADRISFLVGASLFSGRIAGSAIEGTITGAAGATLWKATRIR
jgi:SAM-dependent methyltransferase